MQRPAFWSVAFTADGKRLLSGGMDRTVRIWDIAAGKELKELGHHADAVLTVRCSPDGKVAATACADGAITLWDMNTRKPVRRLTGRPTANLFGQRLPLAFSPDGKRLAVAGSRHPVEVWDVASGKEVLHFGGRRGGVHAVAITRDGRSLAMAGPDGSIRLWRVGDRREVRRLRGHEAAVRSLAFSEDCKVLASAGDDRTLRLWGPTTGEERHRIPTRSNDGHRVVFSPDGRVVASGNGDGSVDLWETVSGRRLHRLEGRGWGPPLFGLAFSPDGTRLASAGWQQLTRLWDVTAGKEVRVFGERDHWALDIGFSPDGRTLASADCTLFGEVHARLWDCSTGAELRSLKGEPTARFCRLSFSPDGKSLVVIGEDGLVRVCEAATGEERRRLSVPVYLPASIAYAPRKQVLACGGADGITRLWDLTGRLREGRPRPKQLTASELDACWDALASADAKRAYESLCALAAAPESAVAFLAARLRPAKPDPEVIARLIRDLDSEDFAVRRQAEEALEKQGEAVRPALQRALQGRPSLEVRKRIDRLLQVPIPNAALARLRESRAVEALEQMDTTQAIRLLETLSKDDSETALRREARAAVNRLRRPANVP